jgi:hypothetical protein
MLIRNRVVGDLCPVNRPIRNFRRRDRAVRNLVHRHGKRRNLFRRDRAILNILSIHHTIATHTESNLDPLGLKTIHCKRCDCRDQNIAVVQIDQSVETDVHWIPHLFHMKPCPHIERRIDQGVNCPRAHNHSVPSTRVGGDRIVIQNACRDHVDRHIFENGGQQVFEIGCPGNVQTEKSQRQKRQILGIDLVRISWRGLHRLDCMDHIIDIGVRIKDLAVCDVERHFHVFLRNRIGNNDGLIVDVQTMRINIVEFLFSCAQVVQIVGRRQNGIVGYF